MGHDGLFPDHDINGTDHAAFEPGAGKHLPDDIGAGGLAVGAGNADHTHGFAGVIKKVGSDRLHCPPHILHLQQGQAIRNLSGNILHQGCCCPGLRRFPQEFMSVRMNALQGDKQASRLHYPGIRSHIRNNLIRCTNDVYFRKQADDLL